MIFEKLSHCLDENVLLQALFQNLLDLRLVPSLKNGSLLLEQYTHAVERQYFQRFRADDPIEDEKELFGRHVPDKTVKNPRKYYLQGLDLQLFKLSHDFFLSTEQQLLEQDAKTCIENRLPKIESGSEETVLSSIRQFAQICLKISQISSDEVEVQQKGAIQLAKLLEGRLQWMGANLSSLISEGLSCLMRTIWASCLSQIKVSYILRMASLKTKYTGFLRISLESDLIICFQIFSYRANSTLFPEYSQKHQKYLRYTLTRYPLIHPKHKKASISLAMFSPYMIFLARFSRSLRSESKSPPNIFSAWFKKAYFCFNCVCLLTLRSSVWKTKISDSRRTGEFLMRIDDKNWRRELESQTYVTLSSSSSYSYSRRILLDMLLNSFIIIYDHFNRKGYRSTFGSRSKGTLRVLF